MTDGKPEEGEPDHEGAVVVEGARPEPTENGGIEAEEDLTVLEVLPRVVVEVGVQAEVAKEEVGDVDATSVELEQGWGVEKLFHAKYSCSQRWQVAN